MVTVSLQTHATGKPGYLGDRADLGLDPKSSRRMEAPAYHDAAKVTCATSHPQTTALPGLQGRADSSCEYSMQDEQTGHGKRGMCHRLQLWCVSSSYP